MGLNEHLLHIAREAEKFLNSGEVKHCRSFLNAFNSVWEDMTEEERKVFIDKENKVYSRMLDMNKKLAKEQSTALDMFQTDDSQ